MPLTPLQITIINNANANPGFTGNELPEMKIQNILGVKTPHVDTDISLTKMKLSLTFLINRAASLDLFTTRDGLQGGRCHQIPGAIADGKINCKALYTSTKSMKQGRLLHIRKPHINTQHTVTRQTLDWDNQERSRSPCLIFREINKIIKK